VPVHPPPKKRGKGKWIALIVALLLLVVCGGGGAILVLGGGLGAYWATVPTGQTTTVEPADDKPTPKEGGSSSGKAGKSGGSAKGGNSGGSAKGGKSGGKGGRPPRRNSR